MSKRKRTAVERERDLARLAALYCRGVSQLSIAEQLGVSRTQVAYDLHILVQRWQEASVAQLDEKKAIELARIDNLERTCWEAWEKSKGEVSDARFLELVGQCIDRRIIVLGLRAPFRAKLDSKVEVTHQGTVQVQVVETIVHTREEARLLMGYLQQQREGHNGTNGSGTS